MIAAFSVGNPSIKNYIIYLPTSSFFYVMKNILTDRISRYHYIAILIALIIATTLVVKIFTWD